MPLAVIVLGRDVLLSLSAFWIRYTSLPPPVSTFFGLPVRSEKGCRGFVNYIRGCNTMQKTFSRYWDFSIPSAEVRPTGISKVRLSAMNSVSHQNTIRELTFCGCICLDQYCTSTALDGCDDS